MTEAAVTRPRLGYHLFSAFSRSLFINISILAANTMAVAAFGAGSFSRLFFWGTLVTIGLYLALIVVRTSTAHTVYRSLLVALGLATLAVWWKPGAAAVIYAFGIIVLVTDMVGMNIGAMVLHDVTSPVVFRDLQQRIVTLELGARLLAAGVVWLISMGGRLDWCLAVILVMLVGHFVALLQLGTGAAPRSGTGRLSLPETAWRRLQRGFAFMTGNDLARLLVILAVWTHVTKFLTEYAFYATVRQELVSPAQITAFASAAMVAINLLTLIFQLFVAKRLTTSRPLSVLFAVQPIAIVAIGSLALVMAPFMPVVALMVSYQCINRGIQLPVSRQCQVPMPQDQRNALTFLISLMTAVSGLLVSGLFSGAAVPTAIVLTLLVGLGASAFFLIAELDSHYLKNLWRSYREGRGDCWQAVADDPLALPDVVDWSLGGDNDDPLAAARMAKAFDSLRTRTAPSAARNTLRQILAETAAVPAKQGDLLLWGYGHLADRESLAVLVHHHKAMLKASEPDVVSAGITSLYRAGMQGQTDRLAAFRDHAQPAVVSVADRCQQAEALLATLAMETLPAVDRHHVRTLCLVLLSETQTPDVEAVLRSLVIRPLPPFHRGLLRALTADPAPVSRAVLLACLPTPQRPASLTPVLAAMGAESFEAAAPWRQALARLPSGSGSAGHDWLVAALKALILAGGSPDTGRWHALFVTEWSVGVAVVPLALRNSIADLAAGTPDAERLLDIHLEALKPTPWHRIWIYLTALAPTATQRAAALEDVAKAVMAEQA